MFLINEIMATMFYSWQGEEVLTVGFLATLTDIVSCSCYLGGQIL